MNENTKTYVVMLNDILDQKKKILGGIYDVTRSQQDILSNGTADEQFENTLNEKDKLIDALQRLDKGFSDAYAKVSAELAANKEKYRPEILAMQEKIKKLTDIGVKIQALEEQNNISMQQYLAEKRQKIRKYNVSSKTVSNYYKNMTGLGMQGDSYFMDKKK